MRLRPAQRIRQTREINAVRAHGRAREIGLFRIQLWVKQEEAGQPARRRLVVIASRRVGKAVQRNRCKRLLREVFRCHQDRLPAHCDIALIARRRLVGARSDEAASDFVQAIERLTLSNDPPSDNERNERS